MIEREGPCDPARPTPRVFDHLWPWHALRALICSGCAFGWTYVATNAWGIFDHSRILVSIMAEVMFFAVYLYVSLSNVYRSFNVRHWVDPEFGYKVERSYSLVIALIDGNCLLTTALREERTWCRENCRGRWRISLSAALFARKEDAALFTMFHDIGRHDAA